MARSRIDIILSARDRASRSFRSAGAAAKSASGEVDGAKESLKGFEDQAGEADSILQGLAGALDNVAPGFGELIRLTGDTAGGLEAVARSGGSLAPVLGGVAVAAVALGAAYAVLNERLEVANRQQERAAETAELATSAYRLLAEVQGEAVSEDEARARSVADEINALEARRAELQKAIQENATFADGASDILIGLKAANVAFREFTGREAELQNLNTELATTGRILADLREGADEVAAAPFVGPLFEDADNVRPEELRRQAEERRRGIDEEADSTRKLAEARRDAAIAGRDALTGARVALSQAAAAGVDTTGAEAQLADITGLARQTGTLSGGITTALLELTDAINEQIRLEKGKPAEDPEAETRRRIKAEAEAQAEAARLERERIGKIGEAGQVATGDITPLLGRAGIIGAIVAAALAIGREGAGGVEGRLQGLEANVAGFFEAVPEIISRVGPEFARRTIEAGPEIIAQFVPALINGLIQAAIRTGPLVIGRAIVESLTNPAIWRSLIEGMGEAFRSAVAGLIDNPVIGEQSRRIASPGNRVNLSAALTTNTLGQEIALSFVAERIARRQARRQGR